MFKKLLGSLAIVAFLSGCNQAAVTQFNANVASTTQSVIALNNALIQVNSTIINNLVAQAKILSPYACGAYQLGAQVVADSNAAASVNSYLASHVGASLTNVAVKDICAALGQSTTVTAAVVSTGG